MVCGRVRQAPRWNESLGAYCLNFNGRVTLPSVKNFQLQIEGAPDPNQVSLQFGKTGDNTFTVRPPSGQRAEGLGGG